MQTLDLKQCETCILRGEEVTEVDYVALSPGVWFRCWRGGVASLAGRCNFWEKRRPFFIRRTWAMPSKRTFQIKPIKDLLTQEVFAGKWIDPFAGESRLDRVQVITNDLNPEFDTDYHLDALDFLKTIKGASVDGVLYDPPYSTRQVKKCYDSVGLEVTQETTRADFWTKMKIEINRVLVSGGKVISFGWNSNGIGKTAGFTIKRILLVPHGGFHHDTIVVVEHKRG